MMNEKYLILKSNIRLLGDLLGKTIHDAQGLHVLKKVETIRSLSKILNHDPTQNNQQALLTYIEQLSDEEMLIVARAFNQFLYLTNTAEQYHTISRHCEADIANPNSLDQVLSTLVKRTAAEELSKVVQDLSIDLVLTAHPTEIARRTMINKSVKITQLLSDFDHPDLLDKERCQIIRELTSLITQSWHSDLFRKDRPTPLDEARWGFAVIENSLWKAVPSFMRELNDSLAKFTDIQLPVNQPIVTFSSWIGGDRDGNPFVTHKITDEILILSRLKATELYLGDVNLLIEDLSMTKCDEHLAQLSGNQHEPYRVVLNKLRILLQHTIDVLNRRLNGEPVNEEYILSDKHQLWDPIYACYQSLQKSGMSIIADGPVLDTLRRINTFGIHLSRLDIRQESSRHSSALSELTLFLGLGDYQQWNERDRIKFLTEELASKRPLLPLNWQPSPDTQEVIDTIRIIANHPQDAFGVYVISMAQSASDILAVDLLMRAVGCCTPLRVCPLFETLADLNNAKKIIERLFSTPWYREKIANNQMVMIGYSDSAKDAGGLAAAWAQYRAMEELVEISEHYNVTLTLFHGRGGTVGRGGAPAHAALLSQPPKTLKAGLRVTEQGEMIRFKLGLPQVAVSSLTCYASAILEANLLPPPAPQKKWRELMDELTKVSCQSYRQVVREQADFVSYFRQATPEEELAKLPLGSRPPKRNLNGGVESLRAIPWIFSWSQNRLILPAWLGDGEAIQYGLENNMKSTLQEMINMWPFFKTRLAMLEMVYAKTISRVSQQYDKVLVDPKLAFFGQKLRKQLQQDVQTILQISNQNGLLQQNTWGMESIQIRNIYIEPLNYLQIELLKRTRQHANVQTLEEALMVTISGIAAGMRNTG